MLLGFVLFSKNQRSVVCLEAGIDQHDGLSFVFKDRVQYQSVIHDSFAVWDVFLFDLPQDSAVAESIDSLELAINRHEVFRHVGVLSVGGGSRGLSSAATRNVSAFRVERWDSVVLSLGRWGSWLLPHLYIKRGVLGCLTVSSGSSKYLCRLKN